MTKGLLSAGKGSVGHSRGSARHDDCGSQATARELESDYGGPLISSNHTNGSRRSTFKPGGCLYKRLAEKIRSLGLASLLKRRPEEETETFPFSVLWMKVQDFLPRRLLPLVLCSSHPKH